MVNQQFSFAVHIMAMLAFARGDVVDSRTLAASVNTNPVVVRRLLLALRNARLIQTRAGRHGGARLSGRPEKISLLDIYQAVEPRPVIPVSRRKSFRGCPVSCSMKPIMSRVAETADRAIRHELGKITLKQIVRQI